MTATPAPQSMPPARGRKYWLKVLAYVAAGLFVVSIITLLVVYHYAVKVPDYWEKNQQFLQQNNPEDIKRLASDLQRRTLAQISSPGNGTTEPGAPIGTGQTTRMVIPIDGINAWLDTNMVPWLEHKGAKLPPGIGKLMVAVENDRLLVAFESSRLAIRQIFTSVLHVELRPDGKVFVQLESIRAGAFVVSATTLLAAIPQAPNSHVNANEESIRNLINGQTIDPIFHIDRTRQAHVTSFELQPEQIIVTFKTEKRP